MSASGQPYARWHSKDHPYLLRKRLRLEALLGSMCAYCGLTRNDGANLQFHHHTGRDWRDSKGNSTSPRKLSWSQRLCKYEAEIKAGLLRYLACDQTGNNCHEKCRKQVPGNQATKLYNYDPDPAPHPF